MIETRGPVAPRRGDGRRCSSARERGTRWPDDAVSATSPSRGGGRRRRRHIKAATDAGAQAIKAIKAKWSACMLSRPSAQRIDPDLVRSIRSIRTSPPANSWTKKDPNEVPPQREHHRSCGLLLGSIGEMVDVLLSSARFAPSMKDAPVDAIIGINVDKWTCLKQQPQREKNLPAAIPELVNKLRVARGVSVSGVFIADLESFEQRTGVQLPEELKALSDYQRYQLSDDGPKICHRL